MSKRIQKRKCKHCMDFFTPDPRNAYHQEYCSKPECRKASKKASQAKWLGKPENQNYFSGPTNVQRVKDWRKAHPDPRPRKTSCNRNVLQDVFRENQKQKQMDNTTISKDVLQDVLIKQPPVFIGFISQIIGSALQEDIASTLGRMQQLGIDILSKPNHAKGGRHAKTSHLSGAYPKNPQTVQLGGSPAGP
jgi:hypothetical protein